MLPYICLLLFLRPLLLPYVKFGVCMQAGFTSANKEEAKTYLWRSQQLMLNRCGKNLHLSMGHLYLLISQSYE